MKANTPGLREAQDWMAALIVHPEQSETESAICPPSIFAVPESVDVMDRVRVYAGGYPARLEESLTETYPALEHIIGEGAFSALAHRYTRKCPPLSYNLNDAGSQLAAFLADDELTKQLPFLGDLAALEWTIAQSFHAASEPLFDPKALADWTLDDWANARISFQPWVSIVRSEWPILAVWNARETPIENIDIDMHSGAEAILVRRTGFDIECDSIGADEAAALEGLMIGQSLSEVAEQLDVRGCEPDAVGNWFGRWTTLGLVATCISTASTGT